MPRNQDLGIAALVVLGLTVLMLKASPNVEHVRMGADPKERAGNREMAGPGYLPTGAPLRPPAAPPPRKGAKSIDFNALSAFDYDPEADVIPDDILALDRTLVELRGVMYYGVDDPDDVTEFFLMPNHMVCCFGTPRTNEVVEVVLKEGSKTQYVLNYYLIRGTIRVGAVRDDQDRVLFIYRITNAEAEVLE